MHQDYLIEDMDSTSIHDTAPSHMDRKSAPRQTLRTLLPTSRKDRHPYRIRHLPNDYRQWRIHCCDSTYRESKTTTRTNCTTHTHTDQGLRQILGGNTDYWKLDGDYAIRVHKRPRKAFFTPHNSGCPTPEEELVDWRPTIINRQGQGYNED